MYHLKRYAESEQSFLEALRLQPGEKTVIEALAKTRAAMGPSASAQASATGPRAAAATSAPPPAAFLAPGASGGMPSSASSSSTGPVDFQKLSADELRSRLEQAAAKLSDEALDAELRLAGIPVPKNSTREAKIKLYTETGLPVEKKVSKKKNGKGCFCGFGVNKAPKKSDGDKLLELRKKWVDEWSSWDNDRLVKRLVSLGIDGDGLNRSQLIDELLQVSTDRYANRCNPQRIQKLALFGVGAAVVLTFGAVVIGMMFFGS
jgi:hypothetical protein